MVAVNGNALHEVDDARLSFAFLIRMKRFDECAPARQRRARPRVSCTTPGNGGQTRLACAKQWINLAIRLLSPLLGEL